jgi:hypothetical protein
MRPRISRRAIRILQEETFARTRTSTTVKELKALPLFVIYRPLPIPILNTGGKKGLSHREGMTSSTNRRFRVFKCWLWVASLIYFSGVRDRNNRMVGLPSLRQSRSAAGDGRCGIQTKSGCSFLSCDPHRRQERFSKITGNIR